MCSCMEVVIEECDRMEDEFIMFVWCKICEMEEFKSKICELECEVKILLYECDELEEW